MLEAHVCLRPERKSIWKRNTSPPISKTLNITLDELFQLPVGVCIADTQDIVRDVLGYEISDMRREPDSDCRTAFQYVARIEWATWNEGGLLEADVCPLSP